MCLADHNYSWFIMMAYPWPRVWNWKVLQKPTWAKETSKRKFYGSWFNELRIPRALSHGNFSLALITRWIIKRQQKQKITHSVWNMIVLLPHVWKWNWIFTLSAMMQRASKSRKAFSHCPSGSQWYNFHFIILVVIFVASSSPNLDHHNEWLNLTFLSLLLSFPSSA